MPTEYRYPALRTTQSESSQPLILLAASAIEIDQWVGVPQRGRLDGEETVGFQREENSKRVKEIADFFSDQHNVVQNPLLCAVKDKGSVRFEEDSANSPHGTLVVECELLEELSLLELIRRARTELEDRVPDLKTMQLSDERLAAAIGRAREVHDLETTTQETGDEAEDDASSSDSEPTVDDDDAATVQGGEDQVASVLLNETQIVEYYDELRVREAVLERIGKDVDVILGFSKAAMISYLRPVVLVDGQHRLRGAVRTARLYLDTDEGRQDLQELEDNGVEPDVAGENIIAHRARLLPVSLLMDDSPAEHVFQFVVVNQKATPMGTALLGTIVSTSLAQDELENVAERLKKAGIQLEESQAVAYLTRSPGSPFYGRVQTGVSGDKPNALQWGVLKALSSIFRDLRGGRLYHQTNDYAALWRQKLLLKSAFVDEAESPEKAFEIWSATDGPWRDIFVRFFTNVRDRFGDTEDMGAHNAWGSTTSNLFNKVSLTILAADFFQFLFDRQLTISSVHDIDDIMDDWLKDVNTAYFNRDWRMGGLKKDQGPVQKAWAGNWFEYRKNPARQPDVRSYRPS